MKSIILLSFCLPYLYLSYRRVHQGVRQCWRWCLSSWITRKTDSLARQHLNMTFPLLILIGSISNSVLEPAREIRTSLAKGEGRAPASRRTDAVRVSASGSPQSILTSAQDSSTSPTPSTFLASFTGVGPTASGLITLSSSTAFLASSPSMARIRGPSMPLSMTARATCTPFGPNSRARDCPRARWANIPAAKVPNLAEPRREAVAPVMRRVGGFTGEAEMEVWRRGRACWAKR